jgi:hypothetical protein
MLALDMPDNSTRFSKGVHDYYAHFANNADAKIGALLVFDVATGGLLLATLPSGWAPLLLAWIAIAACAGAALLSLSGMYPRLSSGGTSPIFWGDVATRESATAYGSEVAALSAADVERAYAENNWYVAAVLQNKFILIRLALLLTGIALVAAGISVPIR